LPQSDPSSVTNRPTRSSVPPQQAAGRVLVVRAGAALAVAEVIRAAEADSQDGGFRAVLEDAAGLGVDADPVEGRAAKQASSASTSSITRMTTSSPTTMPWNSVTSRSSTLKSGP